MKFYSYLDDRLTHAYDDDKIMLSRDEMIWNHGDLSPFNLKLLDGGCVAFFILDIALWGPPDWEVFVLFATL